MLKLDFFRVSINDIVAHPLSPRQGLEDESLRFINQYWQRLAGQEPMPRCEAIDPLDMFPHLSGLALADVADGGRDFDLRLLGTELDHRFEAFYTSWRVSQIPDDAVRNALFSSLIPATREHRPYFASGLLLSTDEDETHFRLIALPLASEDGGVGRLLMSWAFEVRAVADMRRSA